MDALMIIVIVFLLLIFTDAVLYLNSKWPERQRYCYCGFLSFYKTRIKNKEKKTSWREIKKEAKKLPF